MFVVYRVPEATGILTCVKLMKTTPQAKKNKPNMLPSLSAALDAPNTNTFTQYKHKYD